MLTTVKNFKHMVSINMISKFPIPVAEIRNAEKIYGLSMASLKGKSTSIKTRLSINYYINIPRDIYKNNSNIELFIEAVYINGVAFILSLYRQVKYRSIIHL